MSTGQLSETHHRPAVVIATLLASVVALLVGVSILVSTPEASRTSFPEDVAPAATPTVG